MVELPWQGISVDMQAVMLGVMGRRECNADINLIKPGEEEPSSQSWSQSVCIEETAANVLSGFIHVEDLDINYHSI